MPRTYAVRTRQDRAPISCTSSRRSAGSSGLIQVQRLLEAFEMNSPQDCDLQELSRHADQVRRSLTGSLLGRRPS